jgi:vitamin K-dependent gamma-carboxylase
MDGFLPGEGSVMFADAQSGSDHVNAADQSSVDEFKALIARWCKYLSQPTDGAALALFRICFGLAMAVNIYMHQHLITREFVEPKCHFTFLPFIQPMNGDGMFILFEVMAGLAISIALGFFYRPACLLFGLAWTYQFLLDKSYYQNHYYLIGLLSFLLFLMPANALWSLDNLGKPEKKVPQWTYVILKAQFVIVYFYGFLAKLNSDWLRGEPQSHWLLVHEGNPLLDPVIRQHWMVNLITYGGLAVDGTVGFLLLFPSTFWVGAVVAVAFNIMNSFLFRIGIFPYLMTATIGIFAAPDWPRRAFRWVPFIGKKLAVSAQASEASTTQSVGAQSNTWLRPSNVAMLVVLHAYFAFQVLFPFRQWLYPGDVSWTEQGARFCWHMMLRDKQVQVIEFHLVDPKTGESNVVPLEKYLNIDQMLALAWHPDMMVQFAHFVADEYQQKHGVRPIVRVNAVEALNFRPYQPLIDPNVNLAEEKDDMLPKKWIFPLRPLPHHRNLAQFRMNKKQGAGPKRTAMRDVNQGTKSNEEF